MYTVLLSCFLTDGVGVFGFLETGFPREIQAGFEVTMKPTLASNSRRFSLITGVHLYVQLPTDLRQKN